MDIIQAIFSNTIIAFMILIGVVVFVHELGHFLAGKAFGIEVEEFSIGFGPKAFSIRKGNTDYRINWLPLGGYVRFYGSNIEETVPIEKREKSILHAKLHKRAIVSLAGPLANLILSFFVMVGLAIYGLPNQPALVSVLPNSIAEKSGIQTGDKILAIDNEKIKGWSDLSKKISQSANKNLTLSVESNGINKQIYVTPIQEEVETPLGNIQQTGRIGVSGVFNSSHFYVSKNSFLHQIGLQTGDKIISINDHKTDYFYQVLNTLENITKTNSDSSLAQEILKGHLNHIKLNILTQRNSEKQNLIKVNFSNTNIQNWAKELLSNKNNQENLWKKNLLSSDQTIANFQSLPTGDKLIPALEAWKSCGLNSGDTIYSLDKIGRIYSVFQVYSWLDSAPKNISSEAKKIGFASVNMAVINSNGIIKQLNCKIPLRNGYDHLNREHAFLDFPINFASQSLSMSPEILKANSFSDALTKGFNALINQISLTYNAIKMLFTGSIPLSNLGGPIAIAGVAGEAAKGGIIIFLMTMAFISTNVGMMNLLPLPALDGGTLFLHAVEAAYGKPLPKSVQLTVQKIGVIIILSLFVVVFYNDILRLIRF
ncbi:RIP metalloprotease RseP [Silvanigrella aquatica]|uniref:RIP metalloprotease RseP n=1 Tax=Silvanigrella aquatica TaxID=1915309 RepID=A0A1L4D1Q4_9BACT|nr:RIP metalloprotease RseP [Silvanigrella aquatica]APJ04120.1 RIP metalloprotease RseP [Silvanigrella aquatica]